MSKAVDDVNLIEKAEGKTYSAEERDKKYAMQFDKHQKNLLLNKVIDGVSTTVSEVAKNDTVSPVIQTAYNILKDILRSGKGK